MKTKLLLLVLGIFCIKLTNAQITITWQDFPGVGDVWVSFNDNRVNVHTITPPAPGLQSWDYSAAFLISDTTALHFIAPSATPAGWAAAFPNATHAVYLPQDSIAQFFIGQIDGFYLDGLYTGTQGSPFTSINLNPNQLIHPTPFTYNSTRTDNSLATIDIPANPPAPGTRVKRYTMAGFLSDAWGSLITPAGVYVSTIRVRQQSVSIDSTFIDLLGTGVYTFVQTSGPSDTTTTYSWFKNGPGSLLMTIDVNGTTGQTDGASYYMYSAVGIPDQNEIEEVTAYPNPASENINFKIDGNKIVEIRIFNVSGQLIRTENVKGINQLRMSINAFSQGIYSFRMMDADGNVIKNGKFTIAKY